MWILLLIILIILMIGGLPNWGLHSYDYGPSGIIAVVLVVILVLVLMRKL